MNRRTSRDDGRAEALRAWASTLLKPKESRSEIEALCMAARRNSAVLHWPTYFRTIHELGPAVPQGKVGRELSPPKTDSERAQLEQDREARAEDYRRRRAMGVADVTKAKLRPYKLLEQHPTGVSWASYLESKAATLSQQLRSAKAEDKARWDGAERQWSWETRGSWEPRRVTDTLTQKQPGAPFELRQLNARVNGVLACIDKYPGSVKSLRLATQLSEKGEPKGLIRQHCERCRDVTLHRRGRYARRFECVNCLAAAAKLAASREQPQFTPKQALERLRGIPQGMSNQRRGRGRPRNAEQAQILAQVIVTPGSTNRDRIRAAALTCGLSPDEIAARLPTLEAALSRLRANARPPKDQAA